jgi:hypothetical protein
MDPTKLLTEEEKQNEEWVGGFIVGFLCSDRMTSPSTATNFINGFLEGRRRKHEYYKDCADQPE